MKWLGRLWRRLAGEDRPRPRGFVKPVDPWPQPPPPPTRRTRTKGFSNNHTTSPSGRH